MQTKHNWQNFTNDETAVWFIKEKRDQGFQTSVAKMPVSSQWRFRVYWW
jgi:hypothetical protein